MTIVRLIEVYLAGALLLIALVVVVNKPRAAGDVITSLSKLNVDAVKALQGR
jgi:hypothetical protein